MEKQLLSRGYYVYQKDAKGDPIAPFDPVLLHKKDLKLVTGLAGWPEKDWFIQYDVKVHRPHLTVADRKMGLPDRIEEIKCLRVDGNGYLGTQGVVLHWATEQEAQEYLDSIEDCPAPAKPK
jgi:hypothetical protein